jgi:ribonuclease E
VRGVTGRPWRLRDRAAADRHAVHHRARRVPADRADHDHHPADHDRHDADHDHYATDHDHNPAGDDDGYHDDNDHTAPNHHDHAADHDHSAGYHDAYGRRVPGRSA